MTEMRTTGARGTVGPVRAREPDRAGYAVRSGVRLYYEVHGDGPTTVLLLPPWSIVHSRIWKLQVPYLARHAQVVVYDGRGNGRSDRPAGPVGVRRRRAGRRRGRRAGRGRGSGSGRGRTLGGSPGAAGAGGRPPGPGARCGLRRRGPSCSQDRPNPIEDAFERERDSYDGWWRWNAHHWRRDQAGFAEFFFGEAFPERALDQAGGGRGGVGARDRRGDAGRRPTRHGAGSLGPAEALRRDREGALSVARDARRRRPHHPAPRRRWPSPARSGCPIDVVVGGGHCVQARHPVWFNLRLRRFVEEVSGRASA